MEKEELLVAKYENEQKALKNEIKTLNRRIPYVLFGIIILGIVLISLFDEKLNSYIGGSSNFILIAGFIIAVIIIIFMLSTKSTIKKKTKESKNLGSKIYNLLKLKEQD